MSNSSKSECMKTYNTVPEFFSSMLGLTNVSKKTDSITSIFKEKTGNFTNFLSFLLNIFLFVCIFPLIPLFFILAVMLSVIKYILLKFRIL